MTYINESERRFRSISDHPVYSTLVSFSVAFFTAALGTDILYWRSAEVMWQNFSAWLLFAGLVTGGVAAIFALIAVLIVRRLRASGPDWPRLIGSILVLALALINSLFHAGDGWTAVVPYGILLSALTVVVMAAMAWLVGPRANRENAGVLVDA